jgi:hypothetical protein
MRAQQNERANGIRAPKRESFALLDRKRDGASAMTK